MKAMDDKKVGVHTWVGMEVGEDIDSVSIDSNSSVDSAISATSSSSGLEDDTYSSPLSNGPLYDLTDLMFHLPTTKRGLYKYFEGKSQSFTSLASVERIEDLAKRLNPRRKKMQAHKNGNGCLDGQKMHYPKATISKKAASKGRTRLLSSLGKKRGPNIGFCGSNSPSVATNYPACKLRL